MSKQHERDRQTIGRYEVFMRGDECDVIMKAGTIERNLTAEEAHMLLAVYPQRRVVPGSSPRRHTAATIKSNFSIP